PLETPFAISEDRDEVDLGSFADHWLVLIGRGRWRQIDEIAQPGVLEKRSRGDEQVMRVVGDQPALEQGGDGAVASRAADVLDARAGDGLPIGDDGQHLERRLAQRHWALDVQMSLDG